MLLLLEASSNKLASRNSTGLGYTSSLNVHLSSSRVHKDVLHKLIAELIQVVSSVGKNEPENAAGKNTAPTAFQLGAGDVETHGVPTIRLRL